MSSSTYQKPKLVLTEIPAELYQTLVEYAATFDITPADAKAFPRFLSDTAAHSLNIADRFDFNEELARRAKILVNYIRNVEPQVYAEFLEWYYQPDCGQDRPNILELAKQKREGAR